MVAETIEIAVSKDIENAPAELANVIYLNAYQCIIVEEFVVLEYDVCCLSFSPLSCLISFQDVRVEATRVTVDAPQERVCIEFEQPLPAGRTVKLTLVAVATVTNENAEETAGAVVSIC